MRIVAFLIVLLAGGFIFTNLVTLSSAQSSTDVSGIIYSSTTWTKANSPYTLTGPLCVFQGSTLTIEPEVTVNLNDYYIQVNGTLTAKGTASAKIYFYEGSIFFTPLSNDWNEQTSSGSTIQQVISTGLISISETSVKITENSLSELEINGGSSIISNNSIHSITIKDGLPNITNNDVAYSFTIGGGSPTVTSNTIDTRLVVNRGSPQISNNKIYDGVHADSSGGQLTLSNNEISSKSEYRLLFVAGIYADISNNQFIGGNKNPVGIGVAGVLSSATITENQIFGCYTGISIDQCTVKIEQNTIFNNTVGINANFYPPMYGSSGPWAENKTANIQANNITKNSIGIQFNPYMPNSIITNNNLYENSQFNFKLQSTIDIPVPNNWWGTTDTQTINQTIFDFKKDFNLGNVTFIPFLTQPNTATPNNSQPTPTQTPTFTLNPTQSPTSKPSTSIPPTQNPPASSNPTDTPGISQSEFYTAITIFAIAIVALSAIIAALILKVRKLSKPEHQ